MRSYVHVITGTIYCETPEERRRRRMPVIDDVKIVAIKLLPEHALDGGAGESLLLEIMLMKASVELTTK